MTQSQDDQIKALDKFSDYGPAIQQLLQESGREIRLFSPDLDPEIFSSETVVEALKQWLLKNRQAKVKVLVQSVARLVQGQHALLALSRRLSSGFQIQVINSDTGMVKVPEHSYVLVDRKRILYQASAGFPKGFYHLNDAASVTRLGDEFTELWRHSQASRELRVLGI